MPLDEYSRKRNFSVTPEPIGGARRKRGIPIFVVQKHDATALHYDFRLEIDGALASWAIPKAPSMNPADKRLAIRTEDHPIEYANFEGAIPDGQYGAGPVIVWDKGTYKLEDDIPGDVQLARGKIDFELSGTKLRGAFTLIHTGRRSTNHADRKRWLLVKQRDIDADASWDIDRSSLDRSVLTGRTLKEVEEGRSPKKLRRRK